VQIGSAEAAGVLLDVQGFADDLYPVIIEYFQNAIASEMPGEALEVALGIGRYWVLAGEASEGRRWLERLFHKRESGAALLRARAYHALGRLASLERDDAAAIEHLGRALELWRAVDRPDRLVRSLDRLAGAYQQSGDMERAAEKLDQVIAIATALGEAEVLAAALYRRALIAMDAQDYLRATALLEERLVALGADDVAGRAETLAQLALGALGADDLARAEQWGEDAAGLMEGIDAPALRAQIHQVLGRVAQRQGRQDRALTHFQAAIENARTSQRLSLVGSSMARFALALRDQGETDEAAELYERARNVLVGAGISAELAQLDAEWAAGAWRADGSEDRATDGSRRAGALRKR
jgi:tetratricopeptide (TPR) repeat protein